MTSHYVMVKKSLIIAWLISTIILVGMIIGSYQYTNYIFRQLCGVITIANSVYKKNPPPSTTGKAMAAEYAKLIRKNHCK